MIPETLSSSPDPAGRWRRWLEPLLGIVLLAVAAWVLHHELQQVRYEDVVAALRSLPLRAELAALGFMAANYIVLTGFDLLAFEYIGKRVAAWRVMAASFVGYAISNNVGFTLLSGTSVRYRFYSRWGLTPGDLSRVVVFYTSTFWVGLMLLGGWTLAFHPHPALGEGGRAVLVRAFGVLLLLLSAAYAVVPFFRSAPIRIRHFLIPVPPPRLVLGQFVLSTTDWILAASIFYALLPAGGPTFGQVLGAFIAAQLVALLSHVPGGLGVFEGAMLLLLGAQLPTETLIGSLILFRIVYYLIPLAVALLILLGDEVRQRRHQVRRLGGAFGILAFEVVPKVLAVFVFLAGAVLLVAGARPMEPQRMEWLLQWIPLGVVELAHVLGSMVGVALMVTSHGIGRRLRSAYAFTVGLLVTGIVASLLRGGDFEEALFLAALLAVMGSTRHHFDRTRAFWQARFSGGWILATVAVVGALAWIGLLPYRDAGLTGSLLWSWEPFADAPRVLRATSAALLTLLALGVARLVRPRPPESPPPSMAEADEASRLLARHPSRFDFRLSLAEHSLLWSAEHDALIIYRVHERSWIAIGDPVGPEQRTGEMVRRFVERADDFGARPVFFGISGTQLELYRDFGLTCVAIDDVPRPLSERIGGPGEMGYVAYPGGLPLARVMADVAMAIPDGATLNRHP